MRTYLVVAKLHDGTEISFNQEASGVQELHAILSVDTRIKRIMSVKWVKNAA